MKLHKTVQPLKKGVARVPVIMQMEARECGAISLAMVLAYYKKWITPEQAQADCNVGRDGASIRSLMRAAENYGLKAERAEIEAGALQKKRDISLRHSLETGQICCAVRLSEGPGGDQRSGKGKLCRTRGVFCAKLWRRLHYACSG